METVDAESQLTALLCEDPRGTDEPLPDELELLSNSLRATVQDGAVKPKLHCLMMDPSVSMVTVQSEDSGIVWETASSRCSTPWASDVCVPVCTRTCAPRSAGRIVFIMDEELRSRRRPKQRADRQKALPQPSLEVLEGAERPAMVEVSLPNPTDAQGHEINGKEETHQLFSLVSEGSEILNIIAPPKVSTIDEEESQGLEDHLHYLEETPATRVAPILDETEELEETEVERPIILDPPAPLPRIQVSRRGAAEDYFEKFTLLDHQTPSGAAPADGSQPEKQLEVGEAEEMKEVKLSFEPELLTGVSAAVSMLDIFGEHLDDVFYGGGSEPPEHDSTLSGAHTPLSKAPLKQSGSALFGSEESVLTPIYLPEGPQKIIDLNLLEEPKALAFQYSDLYADAVGTRKKPEDDVESLTSEKSFHSQESDCEDRGYLEKFVLKVEALEKTEKPETHHEQRAEAFEYAGYLENRTKEAERRGDEEEITDFFRNSASSSPCEPMEFETEKDEEPEVVRTPRVTFKDEPPKTETQVSQEPEEEFSEEFLPVEISEDCPAWEEHLPAVRAAKQTATRADETKHKPKPASDKSAPAPTQEPSAAEPPAPRLRPFLELRALTPVPTADEGETAEATDGHDPTLLQDPDADHETPGAPSPAD